MYFEEGDVITLDGNIDYIVAKKSKVDKNEYCLLTTVEKPIKIMFCKVENGKLIEISEMSKYTDIIKSMMQNLE